MREKTHTYTQYKTHTKKITHFKLISVLPGLTKALSVYLYTHGLSFFFSSKQKRFPFLCPTTLSTHNRAHAQHTPTTSLKKTHTSTPFFCSQIFDFFFVSHAHTDTHTAQRQATQHTLTHTQYMCGLCFFLFYNLSR
jgi:hypothetical protein